MSILPDPFVEAIKHHEFIPVGTLHARRLYDTPQIAHLKRVHSVGADADDMIWALINKAILQIVRNADENAQEEYIIALMSEMVARFTKAIPPDQKDRIDQIKSAMLILSTELGKPYNERWLINKTMSMPVGDLTYTVFKDTENEQVITKKDVTVFGDIPLYDIEEGVLYYPQVCNVNAWGKQDMRRSWIQESSVQAQILRSNGYDVKRIECLMIFKDWFSSRHGNFKDYPAKQVARLELPLKPEEKMKDFIRARAIQHLRTQEGDVPLCSNADTWKESDSYNVSFVDAEGTPTRTAKGGFLIEKDAEDYITKNKWKLAKTIVVKKEGVHKRCEGYCPVRDYCDQRKKREAAKEATE